MKNKLWFVAGETPPYQQQSLGYAGPVAGITNNVFVVIGGANFPDRMPWYGGSKKYYKLYSVFEMNSQGDLNLIRTDSLTHLNSIAYASFCSFSDGMIAAGGENQDGCLASVTKFVWNKSTATLVSTDLPALPQAVTNGHLAYWNQILYFAGGENTNQVFDEVYALDLNQTEKGWVFLTKLPQPVSSGVFVAENGKLWMLGGRMKRIKQNSIFYNDVNVFDIAAQQWRTAPSLPFGLAAGTGTVIDDKIYLFGGDKGETFNKTEQLIFEITDEKDEAIKQKLITEKANLQNHHPGFSSQVLCLNTNDKNPKWKQIDEIPFASQVTTGAIPFQNFIYFPNGEIRAGVRTPKITAVAISHLLQK